LPSYNRRIAKVTIHLDSLEGNSLNYEYEVVTGKYELDPGQSD